MNLKFEKLIIDIQVYNLKRAIHFYKEVLGLTLIHEEDDWASFEAFGAEIHLYLHGGAEYGVEFRVSNINKQVDTLKLKGVKFFTNSNQKNLIKISGEIMEFPWGKAAYFKDSEGNEIAVVEDKKY
ncbi:MAG: VOC family protein [Nanoarchaeota archaeon]|nr:VOC family protein [Nanoarchaeota archaeon]